MESTAPRLLEFYGQECPHCVRMAPVVAAVEQESGQPINQLEVWDHEENAEVMRQYAEPLRASCGGILGVPAFYNEATGEALCGEQDKETLLRWAQGHRAP